jgi:hypothetical protein
MQPGCVSPRARGRLIAATAAALLLAAAIAGCGNHGAAASAATAGTLRPASGTSGCGHHEASGSLQYNLTVSGHRRTVIAHIPAGYTSKSKLALVLNLHGSESTASAQEKFSGMDAVADADHFIVAYPQALIADGLGYDWNIPGEPMVNGKFPPASAPSDVTFLTTLVRDLAGRYCIDLSRLTGAALATGPIRYRRPRTCGPVTTTARRARRTPPDTATASPATQAAPAAQRSSCTRSPAKATNGRAAQRCPQPSPASSARRATRRTPTP